MVKYRIVVSVDDDINEWLEAKASRGYKKSSLIRATLRKRMEFENRDRSPKLPELGEVAKIEVKQ